jgi:hypothetical protein
MNGEEFYKLLKKSFQNFEIFESQNSTGFTVFIEEFQIKFLTWGKITSHETIWYVSCYELWDKWIMIESGKEDIFLSMMTSKIPTIIAYKKSKDDLTDFLKELHLDFFNIVRKFYLKDLTENNF